MAIKLSKPEDEGHYLDLPSHYDNDEDVGTVFCGMTEETKLSPRIRCVNDVRVTAFCGQKFHSNSR